MSATFSSPRGTAVVTGASSGLGSIYADRLAGRGYDLLLIARRGDRLEALAAKLRAAHKVTVKTLVADLGSDAGQTAAADAIASDAGVTMLVNNAGTSTFAPADTATAATAASMISLNVTALTRLSLVAMAAFKKRNAGTIVNIGSVLGYEAIPGSAIYSGTKGYVTLFTRGLLIEAAGSNIRVQLVAPAATATEIWDIAGVPLSHLPAGSVMVAEHCVDAALAGLDLGEAVTMPSVGDDHLLGDFEGARLKLFGNAGTGTPAPRYTVAA